MERTPTTSTNCIAFLFYLGPFLLQVRSVESFALRSVSRTAVATRCRRLLLSMVKQVKFPPDRIERCNVSALVPSLTISGTLTPNFLIDCISNLFPLLQWPLVTRVPMLDLPQRLDFRARLVFNCPYDELAFRFPTFLLSFEAPLSCVRALFLSPRRALFFTARG